MESHLQCHAKLMFKDARKRSKDPLTLLVPLLTQIMDAHRAAPVVAAIKMADPLAKIPDTPFYRQVAAIIEADSNHGFRLNAPDSIETADFDQVGQSELTRSEYSAWRKDNPMNTGGTRFLSPKKSDRHNDFTI